MGSKLRTIFNLLFPVLLIAFFSCSNPNDGNGISGNWRTSSPEKQGLNSGGLEDASDEAAAAGFINSLLVIKNGYLIYENYYNDHDKNSSNNVKSVSKSFLSALVGIAIDQGHIQSLDESLDSFYAGDFPQSMDQRIRGITIRNLLTMRGGFDDEHNNYSRVYNSYDWIEATFLLPMINYPGQKFNYNTWESHLVSGILTKVTGMSTYEFADEYLFKPLNISCLQWDRDHKDNIYFGGNNMYFTSRDMARFGFLYMNDGKLDGNQIVPELWIEESLQNYNGNEIPDWYYTVEMGYGYYWWLGSIHDYRFFLAAGHGGQIIMNIPDLDMILVTTSESEVSWARSDEQYGIILSIISNYIFPAIEN